MSVRRDIEIVKGDNLDVNFIVIDASTGERIDLDTWKSASWNIKFELGDLEKTSEEISEIEITNASQGEGTLYLVEEDTKDLCGSPAYSLKIYSNNKVYTFLCGRFKFICPCSN